MSRIQPPRRGDVLFVRLDRALKTGEAAGQEKGFLVVVPNGTVGETVKARVVEVHENYAVAMR